MQQKVLTGAESTTHAAVFFQQQKEQTERTNDEIANYSQNDSGLARLFTHEPICTRRTAAALHNDHLGRRNWTYCRLRLRIIHRGRMRGICHVSLSGPRINSPNEKKLSL